MRGNFILRGMVLVALVGLFFGPTTARAQEKTGLDQYVDKYWAEKRDVKVIQKRLFQKDGRFEIDLFSGMIPNDEFYLYFPVGGRVAYYISEDIGLELFGSYMFDTRSDLGEFLYTEMNLRTHLPQSLQWTAGLEGLWSPLHGKLGFFTSKLAHFDWHLAIGVGALGTTVRTREQGGAEKSKIDVAGNVGSGFHIYFDNNWSARLEYRHFFYAAEGGGVSYPAELTLGVSYFFD